MPRTFSPRTLGRPVQTETVYVNDPVILGIPDFTGEDPFTKVYEYLWHAVEQNEGMDRVRTGNRIKFVKDTADHDPRKINITAGGAPELMLVPYAGDANIKLDNSGGGEIEQRYEWGIRTSQVLLGKQLFPVKYALLQSMQAVKKEIHLDIEGVRDFRVYQTIDNIPPPEFMHESNHAWLSSLVVGITIYLEKV